MKDVNRQFTAKTIVRLVSGACVIFVSLIVYFVVLIDVRDKALLGFALMLFGLPYSILSKKLGTSSFRKGKRIAPQFWNEFGEGNIQTVYMILGTSMASAGLLIVIISMVWA